MDKDLFCDILGAVSRAEKKHPSFVSGVFHGVSVLLEEVGEVAQACNDGDTVKAREELLDVIAVAIRLYGLMGGK